MWMRWSLCRANDPICINRVNPGWREALVRSVEAVKFVPATTRVVLETMALGRLRETSSDVHSPRAATRRTGRCSRKTKRLDCRSWRAGRGTHSPRQTHFLFLGLKVLGLVIFSFTSVPPKSPSFTEPIPCRVSTHV